MHQVNTDMATGEVLDSFGNWHDTLTDFDEVNFNMADEAREVLKDE